jgi:uncharacterized Zn finger protein
VWEPEGPGRATKYARENNVINLAYTTTIVVCTVVGSFGDRIL